MNTAAPALHRRPFDAEISRQLESTGISPLFARLYAARGIANVADIEWKLSQLPSPASLKGIDAVCERLIQAISLRQKMLIVADYDADGATACAVGLRGLRMRRRGELYRAQSL